MALVAGLALFVFARGLVPGLGEMLIAASARVRRERPARAGRASARSASVSPVCIVEDQCAHRNLQDHFVAGMAGAVRAFAMAAAVGLEFAVVAVAEQGVVVGVGFEVDAAAVATVTAGWATARNEFLAAKRDAAVAAVAGFYVDFGFVDEHGRLQTDFGRLCGQRPSAGQTWRCCCDLKRRRQSPHSKVGKHEGGSAEAEPPG